MSKRIHSYLDVVRPIFPNATEEEADYLMWNCTAWPFAGKDWRKYRRQLAKLKRTLDAGKTPCEFCGAPATHNLIHYTYTYTCKRCWGSGLFDTYRERYGEEAFEAM